MLLTVVLLLFGVVYGGRCWRGYVLTVSLLTRLSLSLPLFLFVLGSARQYSHPISS